MTKNLKKIAARVAPGFDFEAADATRMPALPRKPKASLSDTSPAEAKPARALRWTESLQAPIPGREPEAIWDGEVADAWEEYITHEKAESLRQLYLGIELSAITAIGFNEIAPLHCPAGSELNRILHAEAAAISAIAAPAPAATITSGKQLCCYVRICYALDLPTYVAAQLKADTQRSIAKELLARANLLPKRGFLPPLLSPEQLFEIRDRMLAVTTRIARFYDTAQESLFEIVE